MKLLLISNMYPSEIDIFYGVFVKNFKNELEKNDIIVTNVVIKGKGKTKLEKMKKYLSFFYQSIKALYKNDYDLIYIHFVGLSLVPLLFKQIKKPLVLNAHGSDVLVNSKSGLLIQKLITPIIRKANMIVVPSDYFKDIVYKKFTINEEKILVSPSGGIDTNLFRPQDLKKEIFTIGYVSRIDKGKGWDTLLEAVSLLLSQGFSFNVLMLGSGAEEKLLLEKIKELKLENIIQFLGPKPHNTLPSYFNQMNIFAFTTTRLAESLGLVGLEAMACGVPVVGSNIGGLPSYIKNNVNGKLFEPANSNELAKHLQYFMELDNKIFESYKINAINTAQNYDSKIVNENLLTQLIYTKENYEY